MDETNLVWVSRGGDLFSRGALSDDRQHFSYTRALAGLAKLGSLVVGEGAVSSTSSEDGRHTADLTGSSGALGLQHSLISNGDLSGLSGADGGDLVDALHEASAPQVNDTSLHHTASVAQQQHLGSGATAGASPSGAVHADQSSVSHSHGSAGLANNITPLTVGEGGFVEISGGGNQAVDFTGTTGTLKLDHSIAFHGEVSGLSGTDGLDLADISYGPHTQATFVGTAAGGVLTVSDGHHTANIDLSGNYLASSWTLSDDGHGGTLVVDPVGVLQPSDFATLADYVAAVKALPEDPCDPNCNAQEVAEHDAVLNLVPRAQATSVAVHDGSWFDPNTWLDGKVPGAGAKVLIPEAITVNYDGVSSASLFTVRVDGKLSFATDHNTQMKVDTMVVSDTGTLEIGTKDHPVQDGVKADIQIAADGPINTTWDPLLLSRGIISHGTTDIHGQEKTTFLKVAVDPMHGDSSIQLNGDAAAAGWHVGDKIVLTGTHIVPQGWNGTSLFDQGTQDEVLTITGINGNTIQLNHALAYDHDTPRADLKAYVTDYTRNVVIETENAANVPTSQRGHVMFMHNPSVDVEYAEFDQLGRTDKSQTSVDDTAGTNTSTTNVKGRYALHLHETGVEPGTAEAKIVGNAVWGSPGWGIVQHSSSAVIENNATYGTVGAGYVAEAGDETGLWEGNIAINARGGVEWGHLDKNGTDVANFDLGRTGDGFWLQGRLIGVEGNVAAGVQEGFVYFHRGSDAIVDAQNMAQPDLLHGLTSTNVNEPPIQDFVSNEALDSSTGFIVVKDNPDQSNDGRSVIDSFTAWEVDTGMHLEYTGHYTLKNINLVGTSNGSRYEKAWTGIDIGNNTFDIVVNGANIDNFQNGISYSKGLTGSPFIPANDLNYVIIDLTASNISNNAVNNFDPSLDKLLTSSQLGSAGATLDLSFANIPVWDYSDGARIVNITGTKTDSIGTVDYGNGGDSIVIGLNQMSGLLSHEGYYTTSDGHKIVVLEEYFTDRATGEIYKTGIPIQLADNVPLTQGQWFLQDGNAIYRGNIDLNAPAALAAPDTTTTNENSSVVINVLANDYVPNGGKVSLDGLTIAHHGTVHANQDGTITYTPEDNFSGTDSFAYWASNNNGKFTKQTVIITVGGTGSNTSGDVPTSAPTISSFSPDSGVLHDGVTSADTINLTGAANPGSTVRVYDGTTLLGSATAGGSGAWTFTTPTLADGAHVFTSRYSITGQTSAASEPLTVTVDTVSPNIPGDLQLTGPARLWAGLLTTKQTELTITGDNGETGAALTLFDDANDNGVIDYGERVATTSVGADGSFTVDAAFAVGIHHIRAFETDVAGNTSSVSSPLDVQILGISSGHFTHWLHH